jgi:hypothetical protein
MQNLRQIDLVESCELLLSGDLPPHTVKTGYIRKDAVVRKYLV